MLCHIDYADKIMSIKETAKNASIRIVNILSLFYDLQCDMCRLILDCLFDYHLNLKQNLNTLEIVQ